MGEAAEQFAEEKEPEVIDASNKFAKSNPDFDANAPLQAVDATANAIKMPTLLNHAQRLVGTYKLDTSFDSSLVLKEAAKSAHVIVPTEPTNIVQFPAQEVSAVINTNEELQSSSIDPIQPAQLSAEEILKAQAIMDSQKSQMEKALDLIQPVNLNSAEGIAMQVAVEESVQSTIQAHDTYVANTESRTSEFSSLTNVLGGSLVKELEDLIAKGADVKAVIEIVNQISTTMNASQIEQAKTKVKALPVSDAFKAKLLSLLVEKERLIADINKGNGITDTLITPIAA